MSSTTAKSSQLAADRSSSSVVGRSIVSHGRNKENIKDHHTTTDEAADVHERDFPLNFPEKEEDKSRAHAIGRRKQLIARSLKKGFW